jgi:hypothetical protein
MGQLHEAFNFLLASLGWCSQMRYPPSHARHMSAVPLLQADFVIESDVSGSGGIHERD